MIVGNASMRVRMRELPRGRAERKLQPTATYAHVAESILALQKMDSEIEKRKRRWVAKSYSWSTWCFLMKYNFQESILLDHVPGNFPVWHGSATARLKFQWSCVMCVHTYSFYVLGSFTPLRKIN